MGESGGITVNESTGGNEWEHIFDETPEDLSLFYDSLASDPPNPPPDSFSLTIDGISQILLGDEDEQSCGDAVVAEQQLDLFLDYLLDSPVESGHTGETVDLPNDGKNANSPSSSEEGNRDVLPPQENNRDGEDPTGKKRQRQLRNRDAAVRSRERKKMYVKDLEMKCKYLEKECRRLGIFLQCCCAENQALRIALQNAKAYDASVTKQESAVLLLESLLLGSLLWFLVIVCLLILPRTLLQFGLKTVQPGSVDKKNPGSLAVRKARSKMLGLEPFQSFMVSKRCTASRPRMKPSLFILQILLGLNEGFSLLCFSCFMVVS